MTVTQVILPKLGLTMEEGRIVAWRKREGETVSAGEVLFEVETDKATLEVEAPASGVVRRLLAPVGELVPVTSVIALIADTANEPLLEEQEAARARGAAAEGPRGLTSRPEDGGTPERREGFGAGAASAAATAERRKVSPAAKKRAEELGVDLERVAGTGPGGRVTLEDVERAAAAVGGAEHREPLSRMRRAIAERMSLSAREVPQFAISRDVDMSAANDRRVAAGASYTDVIVAACAQALRTHPRLRARFDGDALVVVEGVHVGIAVAVADGLIVPVIRDADRKDLAALSREREELERGARSGKLRADALSGGVFTVSNLGPQGVDRFTALVNPPEAAILAVGRVADRVVVRDGAPAVRPMLSLTLSVDHRVADGAAAARFLAEVAERLESGAV